MKDDQICASASATVDRSIIVKEIANYEKQLKEATEEFHRLKQSIMVLTGAKLSLSRLIGVGPEDRLENNV